MNILSVIHYPNFGGPHNQVLALYVPLRAIGYETIVVLPDEPGNAIHRLRKNNIEVIQMRLHRARLSWCPKVHVNFITGFFSEVAALRRIIRERKIDLILIGGLVNPHAAIAGALENKPVVWQILDTRTPKLLRLFIFPLVKLLSDAVMCTGRKVADDHPGINSLRSYLYHYVPPVDTENFKPNSEKRRLARATLGIDNETVCIGSVGNITPQKGYEILLEAAEIIKQKHDNIGIRLLGKDIKTHQKYYRFLEDKAQSAGFKIPSQFQIIDPEDKVADLLPGFDLFIMSSVPNSEGIPTVIIEAMACAVPVIATDVGAISEVVKHGKTGFIVSTNNSKGIADLSIELLDNQKLRRKLGDAARNSVLDKYALKQCIQSHTLAFKCAVDRKKRR